jgi:hypothetical protein
MLAYQLLEILVRDLTGGDKRRFENRTGLRDSFVVATVFKKAPVITADACDKIERAFGIKLIIDDKDYLGYRKSGEDIFPETTASRKTASAKSVR